MGVAQVQILRKNVTSFTFNNLSVTLITDLIVGKLQFLLHYNFCLRFFMWDPTS